MKKHDYMAFLLKMIGIGIICMLLFVIIPKMWSSRCVEEYTCSAKVLSTGTEHYMGAYGLRMVSCYTYLYNNDSGVQIAIASKDLYQLAQGHVGEEVFISYNKSWYQGDIQLINNIVVKPSWTDAVEVSVNHMELTELSD